MRVYKLIIHIDEDKHRYYLHILSNYAENMAKKVCCMHMLVCIFECMCFTVICENHINMQPNTVHFSCWSVGLQLYCSAIVLLKRTVNLCFPFLLGFQPYNSNALSVLFRFGTRIFFVPLNVTYFCVLCYLGTYYFVLPDIKLFILRVHATQAFHLQQNFELII